MQSNVMVFQLSQHLLIGYLLFITEHVACDKDDGLTDSRSEWILSGKADCFQGVGHTVAIVEVKLPYFVHDETSTGHQLRSNSNEIFMADIVSSEAN